MVNTKYNLKNVNAIVFSILICVIGILYFLIRPMPEVLLELNQKHSEKEINAEEILQDGKRIQIKASIVIISVATNIVTSYLFFNLSERWILKRKLGPPKICALILLKIICLFCLGANIFVTNGHYTLQKGITEKFIRDLLLGSAIWFDLFCIIFWIGILYYISKNKRNKYTFIAEKIYSYTKRIFVALVILIQVVFLPVLKTNEYRNEYKKIHEELSKTPEMAEYMIKMEGLDGNLHTEMAEFYAIVFLIIGTMFIYIKKKTDKDIANVQSGKYKDKELIIYHNPWNVKITPYTTAGILSASRSIELNNADCSAKYLLEDEFFALVDYRSIDNKIIDTSKFKNVIYVFEYNNHSEQHCDKDYINTFIELIEKCHNSNSNYIIVNSGKEEYTNNPISEIVKEKYSYAYFDSNIYWYDAITCVDREVDKKISYIANSIENNPKCQFIKNTLKSTNYSINNVEKFYKLLKVAEYIVQYEALYYITQNNLYKNFSKNDKFYRDPTLGYWDDFGKNDDTVYEEFKNDTNEILKELKIKTSNKIKLSNIKQIVTDIHNKSLGHGSISYYISKKYNRLLVEIVEILVDSFKADEISIDNLSFTDNNGLKVSLMIKENDIEYMYAGMRFGAVEYFSFENGKTIRKYQGDSKKIKLDLGEQHILW